LSFGTPDNFAIYGFVGTIYGTILDLVNGGIICQDIGLACQVYVVIATEISIGGFPSFNNTVLMN
jgi:hypothetical protein